MSPSGSYRTVRSRDGTCFPGRCSAFCPAVACLWESAHRVSPGTRPEMRAIARTPRCSFASLWAAANPYEGVPALDPVVPPNQSGQGLGLGMPHLSAGGQNLRQDRERTGVVPGSV